MAWGLHRCLLVMVFQTDNSGTIINKVNTLIYKKRTHLLITNSKEID